MSSLPTQPPSQELLAAREQLKEQSFRKQNGGVFNPDTLTASAKDDPVGRVLLSIPDGRLGVEGYRALQRLYPEGILGESTPPDFSTLERTTERVGPNERQILMIVCGGQTGVDQAALQVAEQLHYERGGIIAKNRSTEIGRLDERHPMTENHSPHANDRTQHNFVGADGTLALHKGNEDDGTALTILGPLRAGRPLFVVSLNETVTDTLVESFADWLKVNNIRCLNVGGPRQSYYEGKEEKGDIQREAATCLENLLTKAEARLRPEPRTLDGATLPSRL